MRLFVTISLDIADADDIDPQDIVNELDYEVKLAEGHGELLDTEITDWAKDEHEDER